MVGVHQHHGRRGNRSIVEPAQLFWDADPSGWSVCSHSSRTKERSLTVRRYDGDLTFNIYPDLEITIPNHQLVVPDIEINPVGQEVVSNYTKYAEVLINSLQADNANDIPRFGMPFLSSAYLMVDNDNQQFTLWASQQSQSSNLVELGPPACRPPVATSTPTPNPPPSVLAPPPPSSSNNGPSKAAIAGGSIGGLATISLHWRIHITKEATEASARKTKSGARQSQSLIRCIQTLRPTANQRCLRIDSHRKRCLWFQIPGTLLRRMSCRLRRRMSCRRHHRREMSFMRCLRRRDLGGSGLERFTYIFCLTAWRFESMLA